MSVDQSQVAQNDDQQTVRDQLRIQAADLKGEQLDRALRRLEAKGELTGDQRQVLQQLATSIVEGILKGPATALERAEEQEQEQEQETVRVIERLFGMNGR